MDADKFDRNLSKTMHGKRENRWNERERERNERSHIFLHKQGTDCGKRERKKEREQVATTTEKKTQSSSIPPYLLAI